MGGTPTPQGVVRAEDLETDARDAIQNVVDDESTSTSGSSLAELEAALAHLTVQVDQLAEMQLATAAAPASKRSSSAA